MAILYAVPGIMIGSKHCNFNGKNPPKTKNKHMETENYKSIQDVFVKNYVPSGNKVRKSYF